MNLPHAEAEAEVKADLMMTISAINAYGISLTPKDGNAGGFPVVAYVNGDRVTKHIIKGPQFLRADGQLITEVEVDVRPGGGRHKDLWTVDVLPTPSSKEEPRLLCGPDGVVGVRGGGVHTLFDINSEVNPQALIDAFDGIAAGALYISPVGPSVLLADLEAWDVSRFNNVAFIIEQHNYDYPVEGADGALNWTMSAFLELTHSKDGLTVGEPLGAGSLNGFGSTETWGEWLNSGGSGLIQIGAPANVVTDLQRYSTLRAPFARFGIFWEGNGQDWASVVWNTNQSHFHLRFRGVAW